MKNACRNGLDAAVFGAEGMMSLLISLYNTVLIILATTGLTTAWNATGRLNTTLTVWDPDVDSYQPTGLELNIGVSYGSSRIPGSSVDTDLQYTVSESIWLSDLDGKWAENYPSIPKAHTMCSLVKAIQYAWLHTLSVR